MEEENGSLKRANGGSLLRWPVAYGEEEGVGAREHAGMTYTFEVQDSDSEEEEEGEEEEGEEEEEGGGGRGGGGGGGG